MKKGKRRNVPFSKEESDFIKRRLEERGYTNLETIAKKLVEWGFSDSKYYNLQAILGMYLRGSIATAKKIRGGLYSIIEEDAPFYDALRKIKELYFKERFPEKLSDEITGEIKRKEIVKKLEELISSYSEGNKLSVNPRR